MHKIVKLLLAGMLMTIACLPATALPTVPASSAPPPVTALPTAPPSPPALPSPSPTAGTGGDWLTYLHPIFGYSLSYPPDWEPDETPYSILFTQAAGAPGGPAFPKFYVSVFIPGQARPDGSVYNFISEGDIASLLGLQVGESYVLENTPSQVGAYWTFTRLDDVAVDGRPGVVIENSQVWEAPASVKERRVLVSTDGQTYMLGAYYETAQALQVFERAVASFRPAGPAMPAPSSTPQAAGGCPTAWFFAFNDQHQPLSRYCPEPAIAVEAVGQDFEGGRVYRYAAPPGEPDQRGTLYVIYNDGFWETFVDTWESGQPDSDTGEIPPADRYLPVQSIGKLWRENSEVRAQLGWAYEPQQSFAGRWQTFVTEGLPREYSQTIFIDHGKWGLALLLNAVDMGPNTWEVAGTYP